MSPLFPDMTFRRILSLGSACEPAWHLRRTGRYHSKSPFDWLVTPWDSMVRVLADDGAALGSRFSTALNGTSVRCGAYDVLYHHEFPRLPDGSVRFDTDTMAACRSKLLHKMASFRLACTEPGPVLFLRAWPSTDMTWDRLLREPLTTGELNAFAAGIAAQYPTLAFRLLLMVLDTQPPVLTTEPLSSLVEIRTMPQLQAGNWLLTDAQWDEFLTAIPYAPELQASDPEQLYGV